MPCRAARWTLVQGQRQEPPRAHDATFEMRIADTATWQSYGGARAGFAEGDVSPANADGRRDSTFAEVQANAREVFDRAAKAKAHREIVRAFSGDIGKVP